MVEAALFMSPKPVSFAELARLTGSVADLRQALSELMQDYSSRDSSIEIIEGAQGFQMKLKPDLQSKVRHMAASTEFSKSIMKTLAFIAYKQPIKQCDLIKYRTNKAYDDIKLLLEEGFISKEPSGKTAILRTTKKFLSYFGEEAVVLNPYQADEGQNLPEPTP